MLAFTIFYILIAYLIGSISPAILLSRHYGLPDPRYEGSGCADIYNVYQLGGRWVILGILVLDILKGMIPVWFGYYCGLSNFSLGLVAIFICLGQVFPIFFNFRGGKGIVTALGTIAPISWIIAGLSFGTWFLAFLLTRYISLSAVFTALLAPLYTWYFNPEFTLPVAMVCCLIVYRYHENIQLLWRGLEVRVRFRKKLMDQPPPNS